jgi:hypothetical protein
MPKVEESPEKPREEVKELKPADSIIPKVVEAPKDAVVEAPKDATEREPANKNETEVINPLPKVGFMMNSMGGPGSRNM